MTIVPPTRLIAPPAYAPRFTGAQSMPPEAPVPAPWFLTGDGWVVLFRLRAADAARPGIVRPELQGRWRGGMGAVAFMRYRDSGVGPYDELLFIPGLADVGGKLAFSISQIVVTSAGSVVNGRANWGIPKDLAEMQIVRRPTGEEVLRAGPEGDPFAELIARSLGPRLPFNSARIPLPIAQVWNGQIFRIGLTMQASARWLDVIRWRGDGVRFPALTGLRPLAGIKLENFAITFPVAETSPYVPAQASPHPPAPSPSVLRGES
jgi:hypothetical protein